jgi:hypothetical protein
MYQILYHKVSVHPKLRTGKTFHQVNTMDSSLGISKLNFQGL